MAFQVHQLSLSPITAHAFNADRTKVAVSSNTNEVQLYAASPNGWFLEDTLREHDKLVTSIDWAAKTNRIVTCSQDRNAYVWTLTPDAATGKEVWKPTLVLLRINRAATFVRWSPSEDKFAVASGARTVAICSFEEDNDWWVAKHIKRPIRSTVLSLDWHPNNVLIATGCADMKARVFSAFIKGVDKKPAASVWGEKLPFNTVCGEFASPSGGWVHGVAFSPSGDALAFTSHDSTLTIVYPSGPETAPHAVYSIRSQTLPYVALAFVTENSLVAAGHDCQPVLFEGDISSGWKAVRSLDGPSGAAAAAAAKPPPPPVPGKPAGIGRLGNNEAFNRFRSADARASSPTPGSPTSSAPAAVVAEGGELATTHQNTITSVRPYAGEQGAVTSVSTSGVDGRLCVFEVRGGGLAGRMAGLRV